MQPPRALPLALSLPKVTIGAGTDPRGGTRDSRSRVTWASFPEGPGLLHDHSVLSTYVDVCRQRAYPPEPSQANTGSAGRERGGRGRGVVINVKIETAVNSVVGGETAQESRAAWRFGRQLD